MSPDEATPRSRRTVATALILLATVIGIVAVPAVWVKRQALETDTWVETSSKLLEDETIRDAVGDFLVNALFDNVDVEAEIASKLPPEADALAGPATAGLRQLADRAAQEALASSQAQALWEDANRAAHEKLLALIEDRGVFVSTTDGVVSLDLTSLVAQLATQVGVGGSLAGKLPEGAASIEIMRSDQLDAAQTGADALEAIAYVLSALALGVYALAIHLARGRRRETLRAVGFSFVAIGVVALSARNAGGSAITDALAGTAAAEPPVDNTWEIGTSLLEETGQSLIAYGLVIVLCAWLAGPTGIATSIRHALAPYLRRPAYAFGGLAALLVLLFWWNPLVATHRLVPSLLLIAFAVIGVEALRRQVIREFPGHVTARSPAGVAQAMATRMREARERRVARPGEGGGAAPHDARLDQLERLAALRQSGMLSDEELAAEKDRILTGG